MNFISLLDFFYPINSKGIKLYVDITTTVMFMFELMSFVQ